MGENYHHNGDGEDLGLLLEYTGGTRVSGWPLEGDRETERRLREEHRNAAGEILLALGGLLEGADSALDRLEAEEDRLPSAILRGCRELADGIAGVAEGLEGQSDADRRALAQACARDASEHDLLLRSSHDDEDAAAFSRSLPVVPSEEDFFQALRGASSLLRDVEASFREISEADAGDIADAAIALARLFLVSLQSVYETLTPDDLLAAATLPSSPGGVAARSSVVIEHLEEDDQQAPGGAQHESEDERTNTKKKKKPPRMKILWPPLGPQVEEALSWGKEAATARPFLAVALGLTLWPAAVAATLAGGSLVVADHVLQSAYAHVKDHPLLESLEEGAARAVRAGALSLRVGTIVGKQSLRVVQRQIDQHGGLEAVAHGLKDAALDRITHPVESLGMAWDGASWGIGKAGDAFREVLQQREELQEWMAAQQEGLQ